MVRSCDMTRIGYGATPHHDPDTRKHSHGSALKKPF
jgi:hypothetical protein